MWKQKSRLWFLIVAVGAIASGCTAHVYSPPTRLGATDAPATVGAGKTEISGQFALGGQTFGDDYLGGSVKARHGFTDEIDIVGSATYVQLNTNRDHSLSTFLTDVDDELAGLVETWPLYAGRVGVQWAPAGAGGHFALTSGVGGGYSDAGGFMSTDVGISVGYNNPYLVPFASISGLVSVPVAAKGINIADVGDPVDLQQPEFTYGAQSIVGLRGKIPVHEDQQIVLMGGLTATILRDSEDSDGFFGFVFEAGYQF